MIRKAQTNYSWLTWVINYLLRQTDWFLNVLLMCDSVMKQTLFSNYPRLRQRLKNQLFNWLINYLIGS